MLNRRPSRIEVKPKDRKEEYDELRKAHVKKLQDELALKGPSEDSDPNPALREPTVSDRIGFVPADQRRRQ